eukprot:4174955-Amphidinium_carterae.1
MQDDLLVVSEPKIPPQVEAVTQWQNILELEGWTMQVATTDGPTAREGSGGVAILTRRPFTAKELVVPTLALCGSGLQ